MSNLDISCCSKYVQCSDAMTCINKDFKDICNYWRFNLSQGVVFYGKNVNIHKAKQEPKFNGYVYLIVNDRAFKISSTSSKNYSYSIDIGAYKTLEYYLNKQSIKYSLGLEGYQAFNERLQSNEYSVRVNFTIGDYKFNVKNYNGYEIRNTIAPPIVELLSYFNPEIVITVMNKLDTVHIPPPEMVAKVEKPKGIEIPITKAMGFKTERIKNKSGLEYEQLVLF